MDMFSGLQTYDFEPNCTTPSLRLFDTYDCDCLLQKEVVKEPAKETTIVVGFIFKEGVIMATTDSSSRSRKKIVEINTHMLGTSAADCQSWHKYLGFKCRVFELENERRISLTRASSLLKKMVYSRHHGYSRHHCVGLSAEIMIAGWDEKGPSLYYVQYDVGMRKGDRFSVGSGSRDANVVLDRCYCYDMTIGEAARLARRSIYGASGGTATASVYYVGPDGWKKLSCDDGGPDGFLSGPESKKLKLSGDVGGPDGWKNLSAHELCKKLKLSSDEERKKFPRGWRWRKSR